MFISKIFHFQDVKLKRNGCKIFKQKWYFFQIKLTYKIQLVMGPSVSLEENKKMSSIFGE